MNFSRYAIYLTLPQGPLSEFGATWLGWDAATGQDRDAPEIAGLPAPAHEITATPRKYGLHGTIKPPFRLADGTDAAMLARAFETLCGDLAPVETGGLALTRLGRFLALCPTEELAPLADLAGRCVRDLDRFRAQPIEAELARRRQANLTPRQEALLTDWGYPYVMDEFRFHITLSGRLSAAAAAATETALAPHLVPLLEDRFTVDALTLCGEGAEGRFYEIHRCALSG